MMLLIKTLFPLLLFFIFLSHSALFAYEKDSFYFSFVPSFGFSVPNGNALNGAQFSSFKTNGSASNLWLDPQFSPAVSFNFLFKTLYALDSDWQISLAVAYDSKKIKISYPKSASSQDYSYEFQAKFINTYAGTRYFLTPWFSLGAGGFYGFLLDNIELTEKYATATQNITKTSLIDKDLIHDNYGAYLEASFALYTKTTPSALKQIEAGLRFEKGFAKIYQNNTSGIRYLYTNTLLGFIEIVFGL